MWNAGLDKAQAGIKIARKNINNLRYADDTTLMAESKEELKSLLMKMKEESEKSCLKTQHPNNEDHGIRSHHLMANRWGNNGNSESLFSWAPKSLQMVTVATRLKDICSLEKSYDKPRQHIKKWRHYFVYKGQFSQSFGFSSSHIWMLELDHKEGWAPKKWCFWTVVLEKTWESLGLQGDPTSPS